MRRRRVLWLLYPSYLLITLLSLLIVTWYATRSVKQFYLDQTAGSLQAQATVLADQVAPHLADSSLGSQAAAFARDASTRVTIISPSGRVLADSEEDPGQLPNQSTQPEISAARSGSPGTDTRYGKSIGQDIMYVAVPLRRDTSLLGFARVATPIGFIDSSLNNIRIRIVIGACLIGLLSTLVALWVSRRISRPIQQLRQGAERYAGGDFSSRAPATEFEETNALAEAMNQMASQLNDRIRTITLQRNEQEAILSSMVEGVIAVDTDQRLIIINRTAARLMHVNPEQVRGRTIQEAVRNTDLHSLVGRALSSVLPVEGEILLTDRGEQYLRAQGTRLKDQRGQSIGALLVFHDITQLRRLEQIRREFVANVSHELKTPITSIKGFVETLQDGAVNQPEDAQRFLAIISRHADRLNSIIEDLLTLSRIEQEAENSEIPLEEGLVCEVLHAAVQTCASKAREKNIELVLTCDERLRSRFNPALLEQAVINLIDNAIKYSGVESPVEVSASDSGKEIVISVRDRGCGIAAEHLPRLWERFYRVDRSRSRTLGGTGLGLAIVKHIVLAHGGRVSVDSTVGKGSSFYLYLPRVGA